MSVPFIAEIRVFGFNFVPVGWATCDGQILPIQQNTALFSLLGTTYGGNGQTTFRLPNLQGRSAMGNGRGPGLSERFLGETGGAATIMLISSEVPAHTHTLGASVTPDSTSPAGKLMAPAPSAAYRAPGVVAPMSAESLSPAGVSQPHENRSPYLTLNFCIALQGIFPPRS